ncbi:hypothetical protein FRX31_004957, partial [Thalictrum thalictroides]
ATRENGLIRLALARHQSPTDPDRKQQDQDPKPHDNKRTKTRKLAPVISDHPFSFQQHVPIGVIPFLT